MKPTQKDPLKALSDPLRISLFELIKEGPKTTPELAEILGENRINLYHHLKTLEHAGLISSTYNSDRVKVYSASSDSPQVQHQQLTTTIHLENQDFEAEKNDKYISKVGPVETIILSPPSDSEDYEEFKSLLAKVADLCGKRLRKGQEILQVQMTSEKHEVFQLKAKRSNTIRKKRTNRSK